MATTDLLWSAPATTPSAIEAALRRLLSQAYAQDAQCIPARVLNMVCIVEDAWSGEIANRLRGVGRHHPSRTIVCSIHPRQTTIDALASISLRGADGDRPLGLAREMVVIDLGEQHLSHLDTIVDPLVISDVHTVLWAPHGHHDALRALLGLAQIVLLDSSDELSPERAVALARELLHDTAVVDLAWLRGTPWRERLAGIFQAPHLSAGLRSITGVEIRHHRLSTISALLLTGWLGSRLGWRPASLMPLDGGYGGVARGRRQDVMLRLMAEPQETSRGLTSVRLSFASGGQLALARTPGGLRAAERRPDGEQREWTIWSAARGEQ